jgi:hypothetical protein
VLWLVGAGVCFGWWVQVGVVAGACYRWWVHVFVLVGAGVCGGIMTIMISKSSVMSMVR